MGGLSDEYQRLRREAYLLARGERLAELRGRHLRRFDPQGLHPYSYTLGKIAAIEEMLDIPAKERAHPVSLKDEAIADAHRILIEDIRAGKDDEVFHGKND